MVKQPLSDKLFAIAVLLPFGAAIAYLHDQKGVAFDSFLFGSGSRAKEDPAEWSFPMRECAAPDPKWRAPLRAEPGSARRREICRGAESLSGRATC